MSSFKQQLFAFIAISGIYIAVLAIAFSDQFSQQNLLSIGSVLIVFILSSLIATSSSVKDGHANAQKFILATTVQMLSALFFILIARFTVPDYFRSMGIHFMALFFCFLGIQAFLLIKRIRKTE